MLSPNGGPRAARAIHRQWHCLGSPRFVPAAYVSSPSTLPPAVAAFRAVLEEHGADCFTYAPAGDRWRFRSDCGRPGASERYARFSQITGGLDFEPFAACYRGRCLQD